MGKWKPDLTLTLSANELSHLKHQPTRCDNPVENPEEQVHWPLTRRAQHAEHTPSRVVHFRDDVAYSNANTVEVANHPAQIEHFSIHATNHRFLVGRRRRKLTAGDFMAIGTKL